MKKIILYTGYINPIEGSENYSDFVTPYGYSGPASNMPSELDFKNFWIESDNWFKRNKVISEFVRFSLDSNMTHYNGKLVKSLTNIKGRILDEDVQWMNFDHKVRKNVKRANRENLRCEIYDGGDVSDEQIHQFHDIYISTMKRNSAAERFFYELSGFSDYACQNPAHCAFAFRV